MIWINEAHKERSLKSFAAFVVENKDSVYHKNEWACDHCHGSGRVVADYEQPDPVEGQRNADRVNCPDCKGTGTSTEKKWREYYNAEREKFTRARVARIEKEKLIKQALTKLTIGEQKALGVYRLK